MTVPEFVNFAIAKLCMSSEDVIRRLPKLHFRLGSWNERQVEVYISDTIEDAHTGDQLTALEQDRHHDTLRNNVR